MSKSDALENGFLDLLYMNIDFAGVGDAGGLRGSVVAGQIFFSLHTADPGEVGTQATNEAAYTGYARVGRNRVSGAGGFTRTGNSVSPTEDVEFGEATASPGPDITHFSTGLASSGATTILHKGTMTPNIAMQVGSRPTLTTATAITED